MTRTKRRLMPDGWSLLELLTCVAIIGVMVLVSVPAMGELRRRDALLAAAREVATELRAARAAAVARGRNVGVRFEKMNSGWVYAVYEDRDFDGIRTQDIRKGIDVRIRDPRVVLHAAGGGVSFGLPPTPVRDPDTRKLLRPNESPIRFGRASLASFSSTGSGTAGSVFLTENHSRAAIVRVYGATGRVRILLWSPGSDRWKEQ